MSGNRRPDIIYLFFKICFYLQISLVEFHKCVAFSYTSKNISYSESMKTVCTHSRFCFVFLVFFFFSFLYEADLAFSNVHHIISLT